MEHFIKFSNFSLLQLEALQTSKQNRCATWNKLTIQQCSIPSPTVGKPK